MTLIKKLRQFWRRRVAIDVDSSALVLDVGCGDKPHWRADIMVDAYVEDGDVQRNTGGQVPVVGPLFESDLMNLPFKDKVFDYAICSHVLEHVLNPVACVKELVRVAKAGYIEVPYAGWQKISDFPSHLWYCDLDGDCINFLAKNSIAFDYQIDQFVNQAGILSGFSRVVVNNFDSAIIQVWWRGEVSARSEGVPEIKLLDNVNHMTAHKNRLFNRMIYLFARKILRILFRNCLYNKPIKINEIICNNYIGGDNNDYLQKKIYKVRHDFG